MGEQQVVPVGLTPYIDASEVWIKEVELNLAIFAHLALGAVGAFAFITGECGDYVGHMGSAEREVIEYA